MKAEKLPVKADLHNFEQPRSDLEIERVMAIDPIL
jgi:hypothetical protein